MPDDVTQLAPAKLNLALSVGPPDTTGLHPLCSWMVTVDLYDELTVSRLPDDSFSRYAVIWHEEARRRSDINWSISSDLAVRAHLALEDRVRRRLPVQLRLDKRIPVGGGLGGGSSDAAAMLRAVNEVHDLGLSLDELAEVAERLGSDVPFLVYGGSAIVEGLGERLERHADVPELHAVLVLPEAVCGTGAVYRLFDEHAGAALRPRDVRALAAKLPSNPATEPLFNDLARPALKAAPALAPVLDDLGALAERPAHVTGSGSTLFVLCDDPLHARALADAAEQHLGLPALAVRSVAAHADRAVDAESGYLI